MRKYLLYGIGEILLVMIGILLALQVNNWNQQKSVHRADLAFLKNLRNELISDTTAFGVRLENYGKRNHKIQQSLRILTSQSTFSTEDLNIIGYSIVNLEVLTPLYKNIGRNDAQIAQGRLERIDPEINTKFNAYLEKYQSNAEIAFKFGESLQQIMIRYVYPLVEFRQGLVQEFPKFDIKRIQNNTNFLNALHRSIGWRKGYINWLESRLEEAEELLVLIDQRYKMEQL